MERPKQGSGTFARDLSEPNNGRNLLDGYGLGMACVPGRQQGAQWPRVRGGVQGGRGEVGVEGGRYLRISTCMDMAARASVNDTSLSRPSAPTPASCRARLHDVEQTGTGSAFEKRAQRRRSARLGPWCGVFSEPRY